MTYLPLTPTPRREARVRELKTDAEDAVAPVREPPAPDATPRVRGAGPVAPRRAPDGFFRDPEAFRALAALVPSLFHGKGPGQAVRVWVAGCGAGEEAWSVAVLLAEHAATLPHPPPVQLFATDTDAAGCARGRNALYPACAVAGVPAARLGRWFVWEGGGYRVAPALRQAVVFAAHDVLADPPFDRLDLVSCRGLLPALPAGERARVLETFHQALRPGGVLFPGAGEWPAGGGPWEPAADGHPVYRRPGRAGALSGGGS
jgi:chemotaxis methyl-accepting protein methylase